MPDIRSIISTLGGEEKLKSALSSNLDWILKSFETNENMGSSGTRSLRGSWGPVYPETTGYLIPTLYNTGNFLKHKEAKKIAIHQYKFIKSISNKDGSFFQSLTDKEPIVFDTAQILEGMLFLGAMLRKPEPMLHMIRTSVDWLGSQLDDGGNFTAYNYVENHQPTYYARIAWLMASGELLKYSKPRTKTKKLIARITALQLENKTFKDWSFHPDEPAYTHTIAYTLRGLWECAEILNDRKLKRVVRSSLHALSEVIAKDRKVAGTYDNNWKGDHSFICATGNAQLAILYMLVFQNSGDKRYLDHVETLLQPLLKNQRKMLMHIGAIPSSIPMKGKYQKFKYTNWTQKFFCDAVLLLLKLSH